ncbi:MAG: multicopper oxidase protein, partial [Verrucomicrobiaceae bacterium]|nr:multicopper oxidase protein [Verrucomicrobiaceae bacterium]
MAPNSESRMTRRELVTNAATLIGSGLLLHKAGAADDPHAGHDMQSMNGDHGAMGKTGPPGMQAVSTGRTEIFAPEGIGYKPVITPNGKTLPWKMVDGWKVFHLIAEPVTHEFAPGLVAECWGYNGRVHGPTIEAVEGDKVRFYVTNRLEGPTTVHWHGILLPRGMDGVGGVSQKAIQPGET